MIKLDHETHIYSDGNKIIKSVSQILDESGHVDKRFYTKDGCDRGSSVHDGTVAIDEGIMTSGDFEHSEIFPYLVAYEKFLVDFRPKWAMIEKLVYCKQLNYAGTLDRAGTVNSYDKFIVDIKSGGPSFWHGLQLNAYDIAMNENNHKRILFLRKDATYRLVEAYKTDNFNDSMFRDYWIAIAKKNYYDEVYL